MADDNRIPGTRVPDTPIHRASMWLEDLRFGDRRRDAGVEAIRDDDYVRFIQECALLGVTVENLKEASSFYGANNARMLTGGRLRVAIPSPTGEGIIDLASIFASVWLDAFMHGAATARGKVGMSNAELDALRRPEGP